MRFVELSERNIDFSVFTANGLRAGLQRMDSRTGEARLRQGLIIVQYIPYVLCTSEDCTKRCTSVQYSVTQSSDRERMKFKGAL